MSRKKHTFTVYEETSGPNKGKLFFKETPSKTQFPFRGYMEDPYERCMTFNLPLLKAMFSPSTANQKAANDIIAALRGPDFSSQSRVKGPTTNRVRGMVIAGVYPGLVSRFPLTASNRKVRDRLLDEAPYHFRHHYRSAVAAIRRLYGYDLDKEVKVKAAKAKRKVGASGHAFSRQGLGPPLRKARKATNRRDCNRKGCIGNQKRDRFGRYA